MRHLRFLFRRILLTRMEVCGHDTQRGLRALTAHDGLQPTTRINIRFCIVEHRARLTLKTHSSAPHSHTNARSSLNATWRPHTVPRLAHNVAGNLLRCTHLLHNKHVRSARIQPGQEAALMGGANTIQIHCRYRQSHRFSFKRVFLQRTRT